MLSSLGWTLGAVRSVHISDRSSSRDLSPRKICGEPGRIFVWPQREATCGSDSAEVIAPGLLVRKSRGTRLTLKLRKDVTAQLCGSGERGEKKVF